MADDKIKKLDFLPEVDFNAILTNPILDIAAHFWDSDRYEAFRICYRSMRLIDDLVDNQKSERRQLTSNEILTMQQTMRNWIQSMKIGRVEDSFGQSLLDVLDRYKMPFWPWERLYRAMVYDLKNNGFSSLLVFLRYSEGAAIAPASVFMHLCGVNVSGGNYSKPEFDIRLTARPLALFSYFVHIIRDFEKDQRSNLNYFADNLLQKYGLSVNDINCIARGAPVTQSFRMMIGEYKRIADYYRIKARRILDGIIPKLQPKYQLSLEMIYGLYLQIFEKIDPEHGNYMSIDLNPSPKETRDRINLIIDGFSPFLE